VTGRRRGTLRSPASATAQSARFAAWFRRVDNCQLRWCASRRTRRGDGIAARFAHDRYGYPHPIHNSLGPTAAGLLALGLEGAVISAVSEL